MPDKQLSIGIILESYLAGGDEAVKKLFEIKDVANDVDAALDKSSKKKKKDADRELKEAEEALNKIIPKFRSLGEAISGLQLAARGGDYRFIGLSNTLQALIRSSELLSTKLFAAGGALAIGFKGGKLIDDVLIEPIQKAIFEAREEFQSFSLFAKERMEAIASAKVNFDNVKAGLKEVADQISATSKMIDELEGKASRDKQVSDLTTQAQIQQIRIDEKKAIAGAGGDTASEAAIKAAADAKVKQLEVSSAQAAVEADIARKNAELAKLQEDRNALLRQIKTAEDNYLKVLNEYNRLPTAANAKEALGYKAAFDESKKSPELESVSKQIEGLRNELAVLYAKQGTGPGQKELAGMESEGSLETAIRDLEKAITEQEHKVTGAKYALESAQVGGDMVAQGAAYNTLQTEQTKLASLRQQLADTKRQLDEGVAYFGDSARAAGTKINDTARAAADEVTSTTDTAAGDLSTAAGKVTKATEDATGKIGESVSTLGTNVSGSMDRLNSLLKSSFDSLFTAIEQIKGMSEASMQTAKKANETSQLALQQIENQR